MKIKKKKTVIVGMSGGVDSSVTAALLKKQGCDVIGVFMKNWSKDVGDYGCTWAEDAEDARKVASVLDIPFYVWNFEKEYYDKVVEYFLREYKSGRTPNPDVMCNSKIKFKLFLDKAMDLGADYVATGHYARIKPLTRRFAPPSPARLPDGQARGEGKVVSYQLLKGVDNTKDQSYFLYTLKQEQLAKILFPIGGYKKTEIRKLAKKFKLPNFAKKDSQGICFIGKINVTDFLKQHIKAKKGEIVSIDGEVLGKHDGLPFYTIGQRSGMKLGGLGPYYVVGKNRRKNQLVVTNDKQDSELWKREFNIKNISWVGERPKFPFTATVSIRYHHPAFEVRIRQISDNKYQITFDKPQRAITAGQSAVIYKGNQILGGGVIDKIL